ncbi:7-deoxyloganetin glucosyltransferase-like [Pistacia vera]|uniref:7-deoxyloganetin glucosyltransferase-like n=1 Tax=Pistacia vera TaxID=55513 RepID=UPI001263B88F|nr:7-deoxyloganetin glucosyltransferase-like [Pistacia vera]
MLSETNRPHAVCVPFPTQGHIHPMLKLAKFLHHKGFHVTFVNTEFNHRRLLRSQGPESLNGTSSFRFKTIPDGLPPSDADATQDVPSICHSTRKTCLAPFKDLLVELNSTSLSNVPPVTCIVSDLVMSFTLEVAKELHIPNVLFWTASASGFMGYVNYRNLIEKGIFPLKDMSYLTNGFMDTVLDWIPGMEGIRLKDMPSFIRTTDANDIMVDFALGEVENARNATALIFNTFDDLEGEILEATSPTYPPIYSIGPLQLLLNQVPLDNALSLVGSNLWKEQPGCLEWLDSKEPNSVVLVNFGSVTVITDYQLVKFSWGLANSKQSFLWVIRPDLVIGESAILPPEFMTETKERSLLANWCRQEEVLSHSAIGGFLTHSGWNSTMESLCGGVPMICWPFFAEQQTNCWMCDTQWGVGMEINSDVGRVEIERLVRELMNGDKGKEMKKKAMEWKLLALKAITSPNGSSYLIMEKMINQVLLNVHQ